MANFLTSIHGKALGLAARTQAPMHRDSLIGRLPYLAPSASTAISGTATETLFDRFATMRAGGLDVGGLMKIRFQGIVTAHNAADTLTIKLYFGGLTGTLLISMAATNVSVNDVFQGEYELAIRTIGSSGTMVGVGTYKSVPQPEGTMTIKDDFLASTAVNTTISNVIGVSAQWSSASAGNSCRLDFMRVEHW